MEEGYDLVIRVNPDPDETLVGRIFVRDRLVVVATPALQRPTDDAPVPAIVRGTSVAVASWQLNGGARLAVQPVLHLSSLLMVRDAMRAGAGVAMLPVSLASHDIANGTLSHWGDIEGSEIALWTLYPTRRLLSTRVSAFLDFIKQAFPNGTPDELAAYSGR